MTKIITDLGDWLISSGALITVFIFAWKYIRPILNSKAAHADTLQSQALWKLLEQVADMAVSAMVSQPMIGSKKFEQAVHDVNEAMLKEGYQVDNDVIKTAVQAAYEKSDITHAKDPVFKAIKKAPNRANDPEKAAKG